MYSRIEKQSNASANRRTQEHWQADDEFDDALINAVRVVDNALSSLWRMQPLEHSEDQNHPAKIRNNELDEERLALDFPTQAQQGMGRRWLLPQTLIEQEHVLSAFADANTAASVASEQFFQDLSDRFEALRSPVFVDLSADVPSKLIIDNDRTIANDPVSEATSPSAHVRDAQPHVAIDIEGTLDWPLFDNEANETPHIDGYGLLGDDDEPLQVSAPLATTLRAREPLPRILDKPIWQKEVPLPVIVGLSADMPSKRSIDNDRTIANDPVSEATSPAVRVREAQPHVAIDIEGTLDWYSFKDLGKKYEPLSNSDWITATVDKSVANIYKEVLNLLPNLAFDAVQNDYPLPAINVLQRSLFTATSVGMKSVLAASVGATAGVITWHKLQHAMPESAYKMYVLVGASLITSILASAAAVLDPSFSPLTIVSSVSSKITAKITAPDMTATIKANKTSLPTLIAEALIDILTTMSADISKSYLNQAIGTSAAGWAVKTFEKRGVAALFDTAKDLGVNVLRYIASQHSSIQYDKQNAKSLKESKDFLTSKDGLKKIKDDIAKLVKHSDFYSAFGGITNNTSAAMGLAVAKPENSYYLNWASIANVGPLAMDKLLSAYYTWAKATGKAESDAKQPYYVVDFKNDTDAVSLTQTTPL